jgi:predicted CoA-substrate-specific enzyme activase
LAEIFGEAPRPERAAGRFRTIVDVGGQDSKVITFDADGMISDFVMNDRCAAGTGRFLEVMARVLEVDLKRLDGLAMSARKAAGISSTCTVFAESEVVSLLAEGAGKEAVAAGVFESVAEQVAGLAARAGCQAPVLFDGGPSHSRALRAALGRRLGTEPAVPPCGQFATALGAALLAAEGSYEKGRLLRRRSGVPPQVG